MAVQLQFCNVLLLEFVQNVIYWPSTEPSIKRCTCVNKRKNSGSRWTLDNNITRCPDSLRQLETRCRSESQRQTEGFEPLVTPGWVTKAKMRKKCCYGQEKRFGLIYQSVPVSNSSLTHNKHHLFENKVWEIYFYKKCIRSFIEVVHYRLMIFPHVRVYLYMHTCSCIVAIVVSIQQKKLIASLSCSHLFLQSKWFNHAGILTRLHLGRSYILFYQKD